MPGVIRWLSTKLNCSSQVASLLAATASGDVEVVRGIIRNNPDLGLYNAQGGQGGGRSALTIAAERGDLEVLKIVYEGAVKARGEAFAKQNLNAGAERGQTPLMRACIFGTPQHVECIGYLLSKGADPFSETDKGETCLHMAAKNAYTECLREILAAQVSIGGGPPTRLADAVLPYTPPVKFVDMRNAAGFTPLHLATLKNSPAAMEVLLGAGASMEAGISDAGNTPHLAKGSTALHIAAARGSQPCCSVLLDFQLHTPGVDLRRTRNQRGLKASQLARLAGHDGLALILSERQSQGGRRVRGGRRRRRHRDSLHTGGTRAASSPDAVLALLVQRAKLLLALREVGLDLDAQVLQEEGLEPVKAAKLPKPKEEGSDVRDAKDEVAAAVAEFTELWKKGELEVASKQTGSLLSSLMPADMPVAKLPDEILGDSENGEDSYAAAAMVQAALNAMAYFSPVARPLDLPPTELKPTSPIAAAMVVQAAIRKLAGKGSSHTPAATLLHTIASHAQQQPSGGESQDSSTPVLGTSTPQQAAEHRSRQRLGGGGHLLQTEPLPARAEAREAPHELAPGHSDEQVRKILSKARRRQRRNALRSIEVAALETSGGDTPTVEASARSTDDQSLGLNPLMDNPLFPSADDAIGPGERRRAALRQAALRTAPLLTDHQPEQPSADSVPEPQTPRPHLSTPFSDGSSQTAEEQLPPAIPWETVAASGAPPANPFPFSSHMPSSKQHRPTSSAAVPPRTPSKGSSSPRTSFDSQPAAVNAAHASPLRSARASQEVAASATPSSQTESVASGLSRRRLDASDAHSTHSAQSATTPGSRMLRTDSSDDLTARTASRSLTPQVTPQNSQGLFSPDISPSGSDSEGDEDDLDSDTEAKDDMEPPKNADAESRCAICMDQPLQVGISTCDHKVCYGCAYQLCSRGLSPPTCPFCRGTIKTFISTGEVERREAGKAAEQEAVK